MNHQVTAPEPHSGTAQNRCRQEPGNRVLSLEGEPVPTSVLSDRREPSASRANSPRATRPRDLIDCRPVTSCDQVVSAVDESARHSVGDGTYDPPPAAVSIGDLAPVDEADWSGDRLLDGPERDLFGRVID